MHSTRLAIQQIALPLLLCLASCAQSMDHSMSTPTPQAGFSFSARDAAGAKGWYPIRDGIAVAPATDGVAMTVTYHRERGKAAGVAFDLTPGACVGLSTIQLRLSAAAKQRLMVCITDSQGVVWSLGSIQATKEMTDFTLAAADARPDAFQNAGKQLPAEPNWSDMRMLTILDISGFMGGAAVDCTWHIEALRSVEAAR
jgi:hypothetical protein